MVQVLFFYLCNYAYEQAAGLAAQPPCLRIKHAPLHISMNQGTLLYTDVFSFD